MFRIRMTEEVLTEALKVHTSLTSDKNLNQDFKNVIFWIEPSLELRMASYGITTSVGNPVQAEVVSEEPLVERKLIQLKLRDIQQALNAYKGVTSIYIQTIEFDVDNDVRVVMNVHEKTSDEEKYGAQFDNVAQYSIGRTKVSPIVEREISKIDFNFTGEAIPNEVLDMYLGVLLPQIVNEVNASTNSIFFKEDYIYTRNSTNVMTMKNIVAEQFTTLRDFKLDKTAVAFILDMISGVETIEFARKDLERNGVQLTLRANDTIAVLNVPNTANDVDLTGYLVKQGAKLTLDRQYLNDVLKQASMTPDTVKLRARFNKEGQEDEIFIESKVMKKPLSTITWEGSIDVAFEVKPDLLTRLVVGYTNRFTQDIVLYLHVNEKGAIELGVEDTKELWYTKIREVRPAKATYWK